MSFFLQQGGKNLSKKKLEKLRFNLKRLRDQHHGLNVQVDAAQCCGRKLSDNQGVAAMKAQKLVLKDQIATLERKIAQLEKKPVQPTAPRVQPQPLAVVEGCQGCEPSQELRSVAA